MHDVCIHFQLQVLKAFWTLHSFSERPFIRALGELISHPQRDWSMLRVRALGYATALRCFNTSAYRRAASVFRMPAMSPTMEEGGIAQWAVKAGQSFSTGDLLLDVETDKAQIGVEAQDDGVVVKILSNDGESGIKVGKPIAVLAEPGDDISTVDVDKVIGEAGEPDSGSASGPATGVEPESQPSSEPEVSPPKPTGERPETLLPSVIMILEENGLKEEDAAKIGGTGPKGRILKGDVLAYLGKIAKNSPAQVKARVDKLENLDLSKIKVAEKPEEEKTVKKESVPELPTFEESFNLDAIVDKPVEPTIARAIRLATRDALLAQAPKASVLRDPILDKICAPSRYVPFDVKSSIEIKRAKPVAVHQVVTLKDPVAEPTAKLYLERLQFYLGEGAINL